MTAFRSIWERRLGRTESPIEALLLEAFCPLAIEHGYSVGRSGRVSDETIVVAPQKWVDNLRVDFLFSFAFFGSTLEIAVECDGHDWHERTKAQAKADRSRDRQLQSLGFKVLRFTGSEIVASPKMCAAEILDEIMSFQTAVFVAAINNSKKKAA